MISVIATKTPKIEMLSAGVPIDPSAASTSGTGGTSPRRDVGAGARVVVVLLEPVAHLVGDGVGPLVRVVHVQVRDHEGRHELREAEQDADAHVAEHLLAHEVV